MQDDSMMTLQFSGTAKYTWQKSGLILDKEFVTPGRRIGNMDDRIDDLSCVVVMHSTSVTRQYVVACCCVDLTNKRTQFSRIDN
jgi:hypothetical protein